MEKAFEPKSSDHFSVEGYVKEFGPKLDKFGQQRRRPEVICIACKEPMHSVGESSPSRDATWAHNPNKNAPWCPLKDTAGARYEILSPMIPDPAAGTALRAAFFQHWQLHWAHILEIVSMCEIFTFINFIKHADQKNLWQQQGLQEWFIPYIFLSTCDFPPPSSAKGAAVRSSWLRCRFDARIRTHEDLWIRAQGDWGFLRAEYTVPARGAEPGPKHLIDCESVAPDPLFLARVSARGNKFQVEAMKKAFPTEAV